MISSLQDWQRARLEFVLIIILQRAGERWNWLTFTFATLLNSLKAKANRWRIPTSAESFDEAAALLYQHTWLNLDEKTKTGHSSQTALVVIKHWLQLFLPMRYVKEQRASHATHTCRAALSIASLLSWASVFTDQLSCANTPFDITAPSSSIKGKLRKDIHYDLS